MRRPPPPPPPPPYVVCACVGERKEEEEEGEKSWVEEEEEEVEQHQQSLSLSPLARAPFGFVVRSEFWLRRGARGRGRGCNEGGGTEGGLKKKRVRRRMYCIIRNRKVKNHSSGAYGCCD